MSGLCPQRLLTQSAGVADRVVADQLCLRSTHILQAQPPDCNTYLSVLPLLFRCKPLIPRLKTQPSRPTAFTWFYAKPARDPYGFSRRWRHVPRRNGTPWYRRFPGRSGLSRNRGSAGPIGGGRRGSRAGVYSIQPSWRWTRRSAQTG